MEAKAAIDLHLRCQPGATRRIHLDHHQGVERMLQHGSVIATSERAPRCWQALHPYWVVGIDAAEAKSRQQNGFDLLHQFRKVRRSVGLGRKLWLGLQRAHAGGRIRHRRPGDAAEGIVHDERRAASFPDPLQP